MQPDKKNTDPQADVTPEERAVIDNAFSDELPASDLGHGLESKDEDGELLNEEVNHSGDDLDVPGAEADDEDEKIGEEDEENNLYSEADTE